MLKDFLTQQFQHVSVQRWILAVGTVIGVAVALRLLRYVIINQHRKVRPSGRLQQWRDLVVQCAQHTGWVFQIAMGVGVARYVTKVPQPWDRRLWAVITVIAIVQAGFWANGIVDTLVLGQLDRSTNGDATYKTGRNMLRTAGLIVVWAAVALLAFENVGIHISTLVAGLGITGVAVAFATQNILSDLIASVSMLLDKPFLVGDFIGVDPLFMGTVERIGVRTTRLRSISGELLVMANSDLAKSRLRNFTRMTERRLLFTFSVKYGTPTEQLRAVGGWVKEVIAAQPKARFDRAHWLSFAESGLVFECVYYVLDGDYITYMDVQQDINLGIMEALEEHGVPLAYGTQVQWVASSQPNAAALPPAPRGARGSEQGQHIS